VSPGQTIEVDFLGAAEGETVYLERVLATGNGDRVNVGRPLIEGAKVVCTSKGETKGEKIIVLRYKPKTRQRSKIGHRQLYTRLLVDEIVEPGAEEGKTEKVSRRKKEVSEDGA